VVLHIRLVSLLGPVDGYVTKCVTHCQCVIICGYYPSLRASPPFDRYQVKLLGDRGTQV